MRRRPSRGKPVYPLGSRGVRDQHFNCPLCNLVKSQTGAKVRRLGSTLGTQRRRVCGDCAGEQA